MENKKELFCIVAGSRDITDYKFVKTLIEQAPFCKEITRVLSGGANGVDKLGELWAKHNNIPCEIHEADWKRYSQAAGPLRNEEMAKRAHAAIIIHKGDSPGSRNMKELAERYKLKLHYVQVRPKETFSLQQLKELEKQLEGKAFVGSEIALRLLKQFSNQLAEYQKVIQDYKLLYKTLKDCTDNSEDHCNYLIDKESVRKALETSTGKFLESLSEIPNKDRS